MCSEYVHTSPNVVIRADGGGGVFSVCFLKADATEDSLSSDCATLKGKANLIFLNRGSPVL